MPLTGITISAAERRCISEKMQPITVTAM